MAKFTSPYFTNALTKELKKADRLFVALDPEKKTVSVSNGFFLVVLTLPEYDAFIRPVSGRDPGNFTIDETGYRDGAPDFSRSMTMSGDETAAQLAPVLIPTIANGKKGAQAVYYSPERGASVVNAAFVDCLARPEIAYTKGSFSPLYYLDGDGAIYALLLPIRTQGHERIERMVRANFETEPAGDETTKKTRKERDEWRNTADRIAKERDDLLQELALTQKERDKARAERDEQIDRVKELEEQIENALTRLDAAEKARDGYAADLKEAEERAKEAEDIICHDVQKEIDKENVITGKAAAFEKLDGVTVIIKGAATNKPVAWISGDTKKHAESLKKAGCKWSAKRSAWYLTA